MTEILNEKKMHMHILKMYANNINFYKNQKLYIVVGTRENNVYMFCTRVDEVKYIKKIFEYKNSNNVKDRYTITGKIIKDISGNIIDPDEEKVFTTYAAAKKEYLKIKKRPNCIIPASNDVEDIQWFKPENPDIKYGKLIH